MVIAERQLPDDVEALKALTEKRNVVSPVALIPNTQAGALIPDLVEARARAQRLGLFWDDPVQRAIAERATDEERVKRLLGGGAGG